MRKGDKEGWKAGEKVNVSGSVFWLSLKVDLLLSFSYHESEKHRQSMTIQTLYDNLCMPMTVSVKSIILPGICDCHRTMIRRINMSR